VRLGFGPAMERALDVAPRHHPQIAAVAGGQTGATRNLLPQWLSRTGRGRSQEPIPCSDFGAADVSHYIA
jgi:hypothetical protein